MTDPTFWIVARATGVTAYVLITLSMLAGSILKSRPFASLRPAAVMEVHKTLAVLGIGAIGLHGLALVLDTAVPISLPALVVPGLSSYRPLWTGLGVVAAELAALVTASFWARRRIGMRAWRLIHWATYAAFGLATLHGIAAGTDSARPWALAMYAAAAASVTGATAWRAVTRRAAPAPPSARQPLPKGANAR